MLEIPSEGGSVNSRPDTAGVVAMVLLARVSKRNFSFKFILFCFGKRGETRQTRGVRLFLFCFVFQFRFNN